MSTRTKDDGYERDRLSFGLVASAAVVALIVVVGVVVFATSGSKDQPSVDAGSPGAAEPVISSARGFAAATVDVYGRRVDVPNNPAGQPLAQNAAAQHKPTDNDWLTAAPQGTAAQGGWQQVFGASVPFSSSDGPSRLEDGLAVGYAHTPQGAALAAAQISYRLNARPADAALVHRQLRMGATQLQAYDKAIDNGKLPKRQPEPVTRYLVASDAFQIEDYAEDMAIVRLALRGEVPAGQQTWAAVRMIMVWEAGDWRLRLSNSQAAQTTYVTSLVGWTPW
ncbi:MAG: hypothetical protein HOQ24_15685 [Mycobacteriaceae bacterium]|nr:hypothetical protein [Mycobacteriaceae bacterium]